eukprot:9586400-Lingulodinium_polyedra.AAC.1
MVRLKGANFARAVSAAPRCFTNRKQKWGSMDEQVASLELKGKSAEELEVAVAELCSKVSRLIVRSLQQ